MLNWKSGGGKKKVRGAVSYHSDAVRNKNCETRDERRAVLNNREDKCRAILVFSFFFHNKVAKEQENFVTATDD